MFDFTETAIPADMTEGDAIDFLRLTCKAKGLRQIIARRRANGERTGHLSAALETTKTDLRAIDRRYA